MDASVHPSSDAPHERGAGVCEGVAVADIVAAAEVLLEGVDVVDADAVTLPPLVERYGFAYGAPPKIVKNRHGDSSGVRGAAWLWPA